MRILIGQRSLLLLILRLASSFLGFLGLFLITNFLGAAVYGSIAFVFSLLAAFSSFCDLGFNQAHIKKLSEGQDEEGCLSTFIIVKLALTGIMVLVTAISLLTWIYLMGGSIDAEAENLIVLFMLYNIFLSFSSIVTTTYYAKMEIVKTQIVILTENFARIIMISIVVFGGGGAIQVALAYVLASIAMMVVALVLLLRDKFRWKKPTFFRTYVKFALPLAFVAIVTTISANIDKIIIGFYYSNEAVAYYSSSQVFINSIAVVGASVAALTYPSFSSWHSQGKIEGIRLSTLMAERYLFMFGLPITLLFILFPSEIAVALFGSEFAPAGETMRWLSIAMFLILINTVHTSQVNAVNRPDLTAKLTFLQFFVFLILLVLLVPDSFLGLGGLGLSYLGAALASMISALVLFVATRFVVKKLTGTSFNPRLLLHLFAAAVTAVILLLFDQLVPIDNLMILLLYVILSLELFALALYMLRELTSEDFRYLEEVFNPSKLWRYSFDEMKGKDKK